MPDQPSDDDQGWRPPPASAPHENPAPPSPGTAPHPGTPPSYPSPTTGSTAPPPWAEPAASGGPVGRWPGPADGAPGGFGAPQPATAPPGFDTPRGSSAAEPPGGSGYAPLGSAGYAPPGPAGYPPPPGPYGARPAYPPGAPGQPGYPPPGGPPPYGWPYGAPPPARRQRTPEERRRRLRRGLAVALALVVLIGIGIGIGFVVAPTPPATVAVSLTHQAVAAGTRAGSFHYTQLSTDDGIQDDIRGEADHDGGAQEIAERGASGVNDFYLRLVKGVVYFKGNHAAVVDQLGVASSKATTVVDRWVSVRRGEKPYKTFADGITTESNLSQLPETFVARSSGSTANASPPATRIVGNLNAGKGHPAVGTAALVITTSSSLPRSFEGEAEASSGTRLELSWKFSNWGKKVTVSAPSSPVPYSSVGAKG